MDMIMKSEITDEILIAAYKNGDEASFEKLVSRNIAYTYSFVVRFVGDASAAEDIVQESFVKAWKHLKRYNPAEARFRTWLMRIVRNTAIDYLRKKKEVVFSSLEESSGDVAMAIPSDELTAEELFAHTEDVTKLERAIRRLAPPYREVILLYREGSMTFEELGSMLATSPNTIKSRYRRALEALRLVLMHQK
jgi:RNA polymerase sigma-70 factor (ECF subfamily)